MSVVVGCSKVVQPALKTIEDYKLKWQASDDKEFFERLKNVFQHVDMPLPDANVIDLNKDVGEDIDTSIMNTLKSLAKKLEGCQCCDCLEDCFCIDCPVHTAKLVDDSRCECCRCLGECDCVNVCPLHNKKEDIADFKSMFDEAKNDPDCKVIVNQTDVLTTKDMQNLKDALNFGCCGTKRTTFDEKECKDDAIELKQKPSAKQANKKNPKTSQKSKALVIADDMVAKAHCSISGRAFSNKVEEIMGWPEEAINSAWQLITAKQANKKKPASRKSSPANSGVGKNSRKSSTKTTKTKQ